MSYSCCQPLTRSMRVKLARAVVVERKSMLSRQSRFSNKIFCFKFCKPPIFWRYRFFNGKRNIFCGCTSNSDLKLAWHRRLGLFFLQRRRSRSCKKVSRGPIFFLFRNFGPIILTCLGPNWTLTKTKLWRCSITIWTKKSGRRNFFAWTFFSFRVRLFRVFRKNDSLHVSLN